MIAYFLEAAVDANVNDILAFLDKENQFIHPYHHLSETPDGMDLTVNFHSELKGNTISIYTKVYTTQAGKLYPRCYWDAPDGQGNEVIRFEVMRITDMRSLVKGLYDYNHPHIVLMFFRRWTRLALAFSASFADEAKAKLNELESTEEKWDWHELSGTIFGNKVRHFGPSPRQVKIQSELKSQDVFISYSHKDKEYAYKLAKEFEHKLISAWIDDRIDYGTQWPQVIQENLDACQIFIVIMSPNAYKSQWVQNEVIYAQKKKKKIFPLLLYGEEWLSLAATQYFDVRDEKMPSESFFSQIKKLIVEAG